MEDTEMRILDVRFIFLLEEKMMRGFVNCLKLCVGLLGVKSLKD